MKITTYLFLVHFFNNWCLRIKKGAAMPDPKYNAKYTVNFKLLSKPKGKFWKQKQHKQL